MGCRTLGVADLTYKRRLKLWEEDPHCHWCGCLTVWPNGHRQKPTTATLDHLRDRYDPQRGSDKSLATVLACYACNQARGRARTLSFPIEWRRLIAGRFPLALPAPRDA